MERINIDNNLRVPEATVNEINCQPWFANPGAGALLAELPAAQLPRGRYRITVSGHVNEAGFSDFANVSFEIGARGPVNYIPVPRYNQESAIIFELIAVLDGTEGLVCRTNGAGTNWPYIITVEANRISKA